MQADSAATGHPVTDPLGSAITVLSNVKIENPSERMDTEDAAMRVALALDYLGMIGTHRASDSQLAPPTMGDHEDEARRATAYASGPTAAEVYDRLREEWDALGMLSFTGDGAGGWRADLNQDDVKQIRALLRDAASLIEAYS